MSGDVQDLLRAGQQPWKAAFEARLASLPTELAGPLGALHRGSSDPQVRERQQQAVTDLLHTSTPEIRHLIAAAFFPQFPDVAARTLDA
ncbi:hypothetical protein, partial [Deinococcus sp. 12RED42]|uniref:hypothetical protein n=1 Tax=Deinococcus sp. 12RED42 TaxID=2745872 RepID=UPI001E3BCE19